MPRRGGDEDESIGAFVRRRFGEEAVDYLAEPLLAGIHAGDVDRLSMRALFPRLLEAERQSGSVIRAFRALRARPSPQRRVRLAAGRHRRARGRAARGAVAGHRDRARARVAEIRRHAHYRIETRAGPVEARAVILAVPAYVAASLLRGFDTTLAALPRRFPTRRRPPWRSAIGANRSRIRWQGSGFVVPRVERSPLLAATWVTSKWPGRAPDGHVLLRGFLGGGRDPRRLEASDDELVDLVVDELTSLLGITGTRCSRDCSGGRARARSTRSAICSASRRSSGSWRPIPGVFVTGSGFRAIGIPDCIADGRETAAQAATFLATKITQGRSHGLCG